MDLNLCNVKRSNIFCNEPLNYARLIELNSQYNFEEVFTKPTYFGTLYNAMKVLHFIELTMPSDSDFSSLKELILEKVEGDKSGAEASLNRIIQNAKNLSVKSTQFFEKIKELLEFINKFHAQKESYNEPSGTLSFDFYGNLAALSRGPAGAATESVVEERYYHDSELPPGPITTTYKAKKKCRTNSRTMSHSCKSLWWSARTKTCWRCW